jgi:outer membrane protease
LRLAAQVLNNNDGGSLKDSDWLTDDLDIFYTGSPNPGKDIYSESRTSLNGQSFDASYGMLFWPFKDVGFGIGPIAGYRYEYFRFKAYDTNQVGLGSWAPSETVSVTGQSIYYKVRYSVPYVGFTSDFFLKDWLRLNFGFGYSDWVVAKDRDDHLLRSKLSEGDCEGSAYLLTSSLDMEVRPDWFLSLGGEYRDIDTTGTQFQSFYDGTPDTFLVDDKITSTVWKATIGVSHRF